MNKLQEIIQNLKSDHVCIQTHQFPDPDAISCAYALQELLKEFHITSEIYYGGMIDKVSSQLLVQYLGVKMKHTDEADATQVFENVIYIDSQSGNANSSILTGKNLFCIDHHQSFNDNGYIVQDIRPNYGACATIMTGYYVENHVPITEKVATGLVYGIQIDTNLFTRGIVSEDIEAFQVLFPLCDQDFLHSIYYTRYDRKGIAAYAYSFTHMEFINEICFVDVGSDCPDSLAATISDFAIAIEGVAVSLVYTKKADGIKFSMRSISPQYDTGILIYGLLHGLGVGGGHSMMAGGFAPYKEGMDADQLMKQIKEKLVVLVDKTCR